MKRLNAPWVLGSWLSFCMASVEAATDVFTAQMSRVSVVVPVNDLPQHLKPGAGNLSLLADFQNQNEGRVMLYLINATENDVSLPEGNFDLCCKREAKAGDGKWRRCDSHEYDWCLTGHSSVRVPAGAAISWQQKLDSEKGETRPLRFRLFDGANNQLHSNEGVGKVAEEDITFCRFDAMAMRFGSFEDVAAVATGEVAGCQGSAHHLDCSVVALGRFTGEQRLFSVLQKTVSSRVKHSHPTGITSGDLAALLRYRSAENDYKVCLQTLAQIIGHTIDAQQVWDYVIGQIHDPRFPWSHLALAWLADHFPEMNERKKALFESLLAQPEHRLILPAIQGYERLAEKDEAALRLEAISKDSRYSTEVRAAAQEAWDKLFPNPCLRISFEEKNDSAETLQPLKTVTLANISPQTLTLPVAKPEDLIFVRMVGNRNEGSKRPALAAGSGQLRLKPGQKIVLHDVAWWQSLDRAKIGRSESDPFESGGDSLSFILHAATPGVWEVPAQTGTWITVRRDKLLKALMKNR